MLKAKYTNKSLPGPLRTLENMKNAPAAIQQSIQVFYFSFAAGGKVNHRQRETSYFVRPDFFITYLGLKMIMRPKTLGSEGATRHEYRVIL